MAKENTQEIVKELRVRNRIMDVFLTVPDDEMYGEVLNIILEAMESKYGVFGYIDENGALVVPSMTRHIWDKCQVPDKRIAFPRESWGDSTWPRAIREKRTIHTNEPSTKIPEGHIAIRRHISMPIIHQKEAIGLIQVANKETDYGEEDIRLLGTIANNIAPVLNARLQRDRQESERKRAEEQIKQQQEAMMKLSTPLVEVWEGIVMLPLIGVLDTTRAKQVTESILNHIAQTKTDIVITDISGIATVDTKTANHILRTIKAVKLMGSEVVVTGIRPDVATVLVTLGVDLSGVVSRSTLREGLEYAYDSLGLKVTKI